MFNKKFGVFFLIATLALSLVVTGCGGDKETGDSGEKKDLPQEITYNLQTEPETLDVAKATGKTESTVQMAMFEGLTRLDKNNVPQPGMAEKWDVSEDGKTITFHLRDGIKWTNGDPVTAQDFEFAWKRLLSPELAADYSYQLHYLVNGAEYTAGEAKADEVGVKALDEKTLEVKLVASTPYFVGLTAFSNLFPVNQKVVEADQAGWHTKVETLVSNGPFKIETWEHNQKIVLVKNPDYWAAEDVKLEKITMVMVESQDTELTMFETDQIDIGEDPPLQEMVRLLEDGTATIYPDLGIYYYIFNIEKKPLDDVNVRKALAMAIDRQSLIDNVTQAQQLPAYGIVPPGILNPADGKDFRQEGGDFFKYDVEEAKKLLADAGYPEGKGFPELEILYNTSESHQKVAEAIQEMWNTNLGIKVKLINQEWGVYLNTRDEGDFQVARAGWGADFTDPMTFIDMWTTGNGNNNTNWGTKEFDDLITKARTTEGAERWQALHDAEQIFMKDMPMIPIYYYTNVNMYKPHVKGVIVPMIGGYQEFRWAYVEK